MAATKIGVSVECAICGRTKAPRGRSVSPMMHGSYCTQEYIGEPSCSGYDMEPRVGDLWPRETDEDFGFACSDVGTRPLTAEEIAAATEAPCLT